MTQPEDIGAGYELIQQQRAQSEEDSVPISPQARHVAAQAHAVEGDQRLRERILAPAQVPEGWKLVALPAAEIQLGEQNAVSTPGWIALNLPNITTGVVAFVPAYWASGIEVEIGRVQSLWVSECGGTASLNDAAEKFDSIRKLAPSADLPLPGSFQPSGEGLDLQVLPSPEQDSTYS